LVAVTDVDLLIDGLGDEGDLDICDAGGETERGGVGSEARIDWDNQGVVAGREVAEGEVPSIVGFGLRGNSTCCGFESHRGARDGCASGIEDRTADKQQSLRERRAG
jgi:hypothetical protein